MTDRRFLQRCITPVLACATLGVALAGAVATPAVATPIQDRLTKQNALVIQNYVERCGAAHWFIYPRAAEVAPGTGLGKLWPADVYRGGPMKPGTKDGQYSYKLGAGGTSYRLVAHLGSGDWVLTGRMPSSITRLRSAQTKTGVALISQYVEAWAIDNAGVYPTGVDYVGSAGQWNFVLWPLNPFSMEGMDDNAGQKGDYHYTRSVDGSSYTLAATLPGGGTYSVGGAIADNLPDQMRIGLKNQIAMARVQVLKDYVDQWKATHGGTLPTADQMTATGDVGAAHTWWPTNPWTLATMAAGSGYGDFVYTPGPGGSFTIAVVLQPRDGDTSPYTAQ
jgi:hypothetical protein